MTMTFKALLTTKTGDVIATDLINFDEAKLMPGDVTVAIDYSTVNYKDAMAISGLAPVIRQFPLIPGIDFSGVVEASTHAGFAAGDRVVANGWGLSQTHHGGYAQKARVSGDWLVKLPDVFSTRDAMAIGTAGYTAMLSVLALEHAGVTPDKGDVLVTGAGGGAGSIAIALLSKLGYRVVASTGRLEETDYLRELGAAEVIDRLAQGADLPGSVLPFILRNVTLAGIDSVNAPQDVRLQAWARLATDLDLGKLARAARVVSLAEVPGLADPVLRGQVRGRTVVDVNG
jgi:acrylyl-CoA reductase (NADPH)